LWRWSSGRYSSSSPEVAALVRRLTSDKPPREARIESDTVIAAGLCLPFEMDRSRLQAEKEALLQELSPEGYDRRRQAPKAPSMRLRRLRGEA
jgi:hypothetical protein